MSARFGSGNYQYELVKGWGDSWPVEGVASDVATDSNGQVYIAVRTSQTEACKTGVILVLNRDGSFVRQWGEEHFSTPHGLWINSDDEIFHADSANHTVIKFSTSGELIMTLGTKNQLGPIGGPFRSPTRAVQSPSGEIFVSDGYWQNRVHRFTQSGEHVLSWGKGEPVFNRDAWSFYKKEAGDLATGIPSTGPGEFNLPHDVTVSRDNRIFVMDRENNRCQIFDTDGSYLEEWSDIRGPNDAIVDQNDIMFIAEGVGSVLVTTLDGDVIDRWGKRGDDDGDFRGFPHGIWLDNQEDLYVAEVGATHAIQKFARI